MRRGRRSSRHRGSLPSARSGLGSLFGFAIGLAILVFLKHTLSDDTAEFFFTLAQDPDLVLPESVTDRDGGWGESPLARDAGPIQPVDGTSTFDAAPTEDASAARDASRDR